MIQLSGDDQGLEALTNDDIKCGLNMDRSDAGGSGWPQGGTEAVAAVRVPVLTTVGTDALGFVGGRGGPNGPKVGLTARRRGPADR